MRDFIELHQYKTGEPILIRINEIKSAYVYHYNPLYKGDTITSIIVGNREFDVSESYEEIKGILLKPDVIEMKCSEEDKKRIEKLIDEWNKTGCTTFSSLGMTDDEWHRAIAGFSDY